MQSISNRSRSSSSEPLDRAAQKEGRHDTEAPGEGKLPRVMRSGCAGNAISTTTAAFDGAAVYQGKRRR